MVENTTKDLNSVFPSPAYFEVELKSYLTAILLWQ